MAKEADDRWLITYSDSKSPTAEAFRTLRTNLHYCSQDQNIKKIMITSTGPAEGKSTILVNLAVAVAQTGRRVLVIDGDLRKPVLHKIFELDNTLGLASYLQGEAGFRQILKQTKINNLHAVTSGPIPVNPSELLGSVGMDQLLSSTLEYDMVFLDSPPVVTVTDAAVMAIKVDGVILVVGSRQVRVDMAKNAVEQIEKAKAVILGVVLNNVEFKKGDYKYYHYYGDVG